MTIRSTILALPLVILCWVSILAIVGLVSDDAPAHLVPLPTVAFLNNLPEGVSILSLDDWSVTLVSDKPGFVKSLYNAGAVLVLPSGLAGCAPRALS